MKQMRTKEQIQERMSGLLNELRELKVEALSINEGKKPYCIKEYIPVTPEDKQMFELEKDALFEYEEPYDMCLCFNDELIYRFKKSDTKKITHRVGELNDAFNRGIEYAKNERGNY